MHIQTSSVKNINGNRWHLIILQLLITLYWYTCLYPIVPSSLCLVTIVFLLYLNQDNQMVYYFHQHCFNIHPSYWCSLRFVSLMTFPNSPFHSFTAKSNHSWISQKCISGIAIVNIISKGLGKSKKLNLRMLGKNKVTKCYGNRLWETKCLGLFNKEMLNIG